MNKRYDLYLIASIWVVATQVRASLTLLDHRYKYVDAKIWHMTYVHAYRQIWSRAFKRVSRASREAARPFSWD